MRIGRGAVVVDSGVWLGLLDARDQHHGRATNLTEDIDAWSVLIPWPCLYETISTRFVKDRRRVSVFMEILRRRNISVIDDSPYRADALNAVSTLTDRRNISLVDMVIRRLLDDASVRVTALVTLNPTDFHDVCRRRGIELVDDVGGGKPTNSQRAPSAG